MTVLAGDVGGTTTRLAWFAIGPDGPRSLVEEHYPSRAHGGLDEIVANFVAAHPHPVEAACFGIAGPVREGRATTPNLPWIIASESLMRQLGTGAVELINDLEANAWGIAALDAADLVCLNPGQPGAHGNAAVIAAGTGLGEAGLYWDGGAHMPYATEGGHADFAPRNDTEIGLLRFLQRRFGHVSVERVVSGPGLIGIHDFLCEYHGVAPPPDPQPGADRAAEISRAALEGSSELAGRALDLFVDLYGAEAGNLALKTLSTAGVYVGGGIAPRIVKKLADGRFMRAFTDKGRMAPLLEAMPVHVIMNERTALIGAACRAAAVLATT